MVYEKRMQNHSKPRPSHPTKLLKISLFVSSLLAISAFSGGEAAPEEEPESEAALSDVESRLTDEMYLPVQTQKPGADLKRGAHLFQSRCAVCHGSDGKSSGPAARNIQPRPADLTTGFYKVRSTSFDSPPTEQDIFRTLTYGLPGTAMPGWPGLSVDDRWQLVFYLRTLAPSWEGKKPDFVQIPKPTPATLEAIEKGRALFLGLGCVSCHGTEGRGDGALAMDLKDSLQEPIFPTNLSRSAKYKGGSSPRDIYRVLHTGFAGTPMRSFEGVISESDTWSLVHFIGSLRVDAPTPAIVAGKNEVLAAQTSTQFAKMAEENQDLRATLALMKKEQEKQALLLASLSEKAALAVPAPNAVLGENAEAPPVVLSPEEEAKRAQEKAAQLKAAQEKAAKVKAAKAKAAQEARVKRQKRRAQQRVKAARALYKTRCAACHGLRGRGDGPAAAGLKPIPRNFSDKGWQKSVTNARIEKAILEGGPAVGKSPLMPPSPDLKKNKKLLHELRVLIRSFSN